MYYAFVKVDNGEINHTIRYQRGSTTIKSIGMRPQRQRSQWHVCKLVRFRPPGRHTIENSIPTRVHVPDAVGNSPHRKDEREHQPEDDVENRRELRVDVGSDVNRF